MKSSKNLKQCPFCEKVMKKQNVNKHLKCCVFKNIIKEKKSVVLGLINKNPNSTKIQKEQESKSKKEHLIQLELKQAFKKILNIVKDLHKRIAEEDKDIKQVISEMIISETTRYGYKVEWHRYSSWLSKHKKEIGISSANSYLADISCKGSTRVKKRSVLQNIFRSLLGQHITLNPIRIKFSMKKKYTMSQEEVDSYLVEQFDRSKELYLAQYLMARFGLRVGSIAAMKYKDLSYLKSIQSAIIIHDTKNKKSREEELTSLDKDTINNYIRDKMFDQEDFLFYRDGQSKSQNRRAYYLGGRINQQIRKSDVLKVNNSFSFTSHMFRRTCANLAIRDDFEKLKEKARMAIGQKTKSNAIQNYLDICD